MTKFPFFANDLVVTSLTLTTRSSIFTGKYATSTGMVINELRMNPNHRSLAHVLTEVGYETAVAVLKVNTAAEAGRKLDFEPAEFKVRQKPA